MKCSAVLLAIGLLAATVGAQSEAHGARLPAARTPAAAPSAAVASSQADPAQVAPLSVRPAYAWQLYAGYTFFRFYEIPNVRNNENGFDIGVTYFPGAGWIGAEGDLMATFGSQDGRISKFTLASGGARVRWVGPRGTTIWAHGLLGGAHFLPQTAYGGQSALSYEMGGGFDVNARRRLAYRLEVDVVGTRFFHVYQYSPKFSLGIVFKF